MTPFVQKYKSLVETKQAELLVESIKSAIIEVNSENKDKITEQEINDLLFLLSEDKELLVEFLSSLAGLLGKKFSGIGGKLSNYSNKKQKIAKRNQFKAEKLAARKSSRADHTTAIKNYTKSLKSGSPKDRNQAYAAMKLAQQKSLATRGITLKSQPKFKPNKKGTGMIVPRKVHTEYRRKFGIKEFIELVRLAQEKLNEQRKS